VTHCQRHRPTPDPRLDRAVYLVSLLLTLLAPPAAARAADGSEGAKERLSLSLGGRLHVEASTSNPDPALAERFRFTPDDIDWRRVRLVLNGEFLERFSFKIEHDVASGEVSPTDVFVELAPTRGGPRVRAGHFKEPFSLSLLQSSNSHSFAERPAAVPAFVPQRNLGVMLHDRLSQDRIAWAVGVFRDSDGYDKRPGAAWSLTGRLSGLVLDGDERSETLLHLGLGVSHRQPTADTVRMRARTGVRSAPRVVDTGPVAADGMQLLSAELALARGSFWLHGEVMSADVDLPANSGRARLGGRWIETGWFLTGERKAWSRSSRTFTRLTPLDPAPNGRGAWEVAARWEDLDLNDSSVSGGQLESIALALNWYLRSNMRVLMNHVLTDPEGPGSVEHFGLLLHIDF